MEWMCDIVLLEQGVFMMEFEMSVNLDDVLVS